MSVCHGWFEGVCIYSLVVVCSENEMLKGWLWKRNGIGIYTRCDEMLKEETEESALGSCCRVQLQFSMSWVGTYINYVNINSLLNRSSHLFLSKKVVIYIWNKRRSSHLTKLTKTIKYLQVAHLKLESWFQWECGVSTLKFCPGQARPSQYINNTTPPSDHRCWG